MRIEAALLIGLAMALVAGCVSPDPIRIDPPRATFDGPGATSTMAAKKHATRITVHEAVTEAFGTNRSIRTARRIETRGREATTQAQARMLPRVDWSAQYLLHDEKAYMGQIQVGPRTRLESTLGISAPLFSSGRFMNNYRAAQLAEKRMGVDVRVTEADIADAVTAAAYDYLEAIESVGVAAATEAALEVQAQDARAMLEAGKVTKSAVLEAEVEHARARREREKFESLVPLRRVQLNVLMGRPAGTPTEIVDEPVSAPFVIPLAQVEAEALAHRPEVEAATLDLERAHRMTRSVIGGELPELRAFGSFTASDDDYATSKGQGILGLTLSIPLFEGGAKWSRIASAREAEHIARIARENVIANIRAEVVAVHRQIVETYKDIDVATQSVAKAEESLAVQRLKFKAGRATSREVLDSTSLLTRSRFDRVQAIYSYNVALQSLHRVRGGDPRQPPEGAGGGR
jgi:outer membrane protein TolC